MRLGVQRRLEGIRTETARLREQVRVLDEQLAYLSGVAEEARTRALVSATPLADRERHAAEEDVRRTRAERDDLAQRLDELEAEQDRLLEQLLARRKDGG